ncbi:hypothetical protein LX32DRAFT_48724 [Colletotrichum zoysiae]|uniref:Uncharacterized protein n=1 Tax=Colletotrichum zoysiae TaxID=1216348 RepID=A0AAD9M1M1_9PEZI|nr:hypothetical protein LX32DRAFT_48724 [Colletotrichum zoysiae]
MSRLKCQPRVARRSPQERVRGPGSKHNLIARKVIRATCWLDCLCVCVAFELVSWLSVDYEYASSSSCACYPAPPPSLQTSRPSPDIATLPHNPNARFALPSPTLFVCYS